MSLRKGQQYRPGAPRSGRLITSSMPFSRIGRDSSPWQRLAPPLPSSRASSAAVSPQTHIIFVLRNRGHLGATRATSSWSRSVEFTTGWCTGSAMKRRGGATPVLIRSVPRASFGNARGCWRREAHARKPSGLMRPAKHCNRVEGLIHKPTLGRFWHTQLNQRTEQRANSLHPFEPNRCIRELENSFHQHLSSQFNRY